MIAAPQSWIFKRGKRYWLRYMGPDGYKRSIGLVPDGGSVATDNLEVAEVLKVDFDAKHAADVEPSRVVMQELRAWSRDARARGVRDSWISEHECYVTRFVTQMEVTKISDISKQKLREWGMLLVEKGLARKTVSNHIGAMSSFCSFLVARNKLSDNPARRVFRIERPHRQPRCLSDAEYKQVLVLAKQHGILAEVATALWTGMRVGELRQLRWEDVRWDEKIILIVEDGDGGERHTKSGRSRAVPMKKMLVNLLKWHSKNLVREQGSIVGEDTALHGFIFQHRSTFWWMSALEPMRKLVPAFTANGAAGPGRGWHLLRHTFATRYVRSGGSIFKLSRWMGHKNIETTMIYAHLAPQHDEDIERV